MVSKMPTIDSVPPTHAHAHAHAHVHAHAQCMSDGHMYTANYAPFAAVPPSPYLHDARAFYPMVSPTAYMPHTLPPRMYNGRPTIDPPSSKRLCIERGDVAHRYSHKRDHPSSPSSTPTSSSTKSKTMVRGYISKDEYRKMKNRQSAARSREKSLANVRVLEQRVAALEQENDYLLGLLASVGSSETSSPSSRSAAPTVPTVPTADLLANHSHTHDHTTDEMTNTDEFMDRVASYCMNDLPDGFEWCL